MKKVSMCMCLVVLLSWASDWPMFHHDLNHTGYTSDTGPATPQVNWACYTGASTGGMMRMSSPAVVDGKVYIGKTMFDDRPSLDVYALGNYAYTATGQGGLIIVDITDPTSPVEAGSCSTQYAMGVYVSDNYAYIADYDGLRIIDVSNPASPTEVSFYNSYYAYEVFVSGNYAYLADIDSLLIIDISNPASPIRTGVYEDPAVTVLEVYVSGTYAYVAGGNGGLKVIDVSNPASPTEIGSCETDYAQGVYVSGNYAYVADTDSGLTIIDVSNPSVPTKISACGTADRASGVSVLGNYAYVADSYVFFSPDCGLRIIDISNPFNPTEIGFYAENNGGRDLYAVDTIVYLSCKGSGLKIINVSDPASPVEIGAFDISTDFFSIDVATGIKDWSFTAGGAVTSSPAVVNDRVYFGTVGDNSIYCLNKNTGELIWKYPARNIILSSPAVSDGRVYATSFDGYLYCLNATTSNPNGELIWRTYFSDKMPHTSPAVAGSLVFAAEGTPGGPPAYITCFDTSGTILWQFQTGSGVGSSPTLANGRLYEGSDDGYLYCLDMFTGDSIWRTPIGGSFATPAIVGNRVYMVNDMKVAPVDSYYVYCINATNGAYIWRYNLAPILGWGDYYYGSGSSPAVAGGRVYVGTDRSGWVICLDAITGDSIWAYQCGTGAAGEMTDCSPAVVDDYLYIACRDGYLYSFGSVVSKEEKSTSSRIDLCETKPNPFTSTTTIQYSMFETGLVSLGVYDICGRSVKTLAIGKKNPGYYVVTWDGHDNSGIAVPSGVYFLRFTVSPVGATEESNKTRKLLLIR